MKKTYASILALVAIPVVVLASAVVPGFAETRSPVTTPARSGPHEAPKPAHLKTVSGELVSVDRSAKTFTVRRMVDKKTQEITFSAEGEAFGALAQVKPGDHIKVTYSPMGELPVAKTVAKV